MSSTSYIIQWQQNPSYCIGIQQAVANQPVLLTLLQGAGSPTTRWNMDPNTGLITSAADPNLCLDIRGVSPANLTPLIVANPVLGRPYQSWNWLGSPGRIMNNGAPNFYVDDQGCSTTPGNPIILYDSSGGCQWWNVIPVTTLQFVALAEKAEAAAGH